MRIHKEFFREQQNLRATQRQMEDTIHERQTFSNYFNRFGSAESSAAMRDITNPLNFTQLATLSPQKSSQVLDYERPFIAQSPFKGNFRSAILTDQSL